VGKVFNMRSEKRLLAKMLIEEAGIFPSDFSDEQPVKSNLLNLGYVAEGIT